MLTLYSGGVYELGRISFQPPKLTPLPVWNHHTAYVLDNALWTEAIPMRQIRMSSCWRRGAVAAVMMATFSLVASSITALWATHYISLLATGDL